MGKDTKPPFSDRWLFDQLPLGALMLDRERQVLAVNPLAADQLGIDEAGARGRLCREVTSCSASEALCPFDRVLTRDEAQRIVPFSTEIGPPPACQQLAPLHDSRGQLVAVLELLPQPSGDRLDLPSDADALERERILNALAEQRWRRGEAAQTLGISRTTLWRRLKALDLD